MISYLIRKLAMLARNLGLIALAAALAVGLAGGARSQDWPQRPVTVIVPFAAGGSTDGIARSIAQWLSDNLHQQFVVENRAGAGGAIAAERAARAPADGYTLFVASLPQIAIVPAISKTRYDPVKDFVPISVIGTNPFVLAVNKDVPVKTIAEFVAYVRAQPQPLSYASAGVGSLTHLSMALFLKLAGIDMVHVPYKGQDEAPATMLSACEINGLAFWRLVIAPLVSRLDSPSRPSQPHRCAGSIGPLTVWPFGQKTHQRARQAARPEGHLSLLCT
jgi:tripartite-type tricarboxylate transporter receptor subunit TctC